MINNKRRTLMQSTGYMTQCSMRPAAAPAIIWAPTELEGPSDSYSSR